jgi:hypothetical protein
MRIKNLIEGLNAQQRSVPQLPAQARARHISVLGAKTDPKHPFAGYAVGADEAAEPGHKVKSPDQNDPYEKGWRAGFRHDESNPYPAGSKEAAQWDKGYAEAEAQPDHYDEAVAGKVEPIHELSSDALDRYKVKAKQSADELTSQGKYRQANDRTMNVMKATGKQIDNTVTNIRKALNRESVDQDMAEDDVADFLARGGKITQVKPNRSPRNPGTSLGSRHIGTIKGGKASSISGKAANTRSTMKPVVAVESVTKEDIITKLKARLGDYLSDIGQEIRKDPDLINKLTAKPAGNQMGPPVKTVTTDDGHEISIHGNEDDGFRISIKNRQAPSQFSNLDEAVMACEMYCAHRRKQALNADYVDEA